jgi:hypothetical protein
LPAHLCGDIDGLIQLSGDVIVIASLQELVHLGLAILGPDLRAPAPVAGGPMVCSGQLGWVGQLGERTGGPAVNQP